MNQSTVSISDDEVKVTLGQPNRFNTSVGNGYEHDSKSINSTPSKISKFTYNEYPQIRPTNPLYTSTATIKTHVSVASAISRGSTVNTVSRKSKFNPAAPRPIQDWRWIAALGILLFFPTGIIALGLAIKARSKFYDGFIAEAKKLNSRALILCIVSMVCGLGWLLGLFFGVDKWPRTNG